MARYTGPSCRLCRRAGEKLFLKGDRCFSPKCAIERRRSAPGETTNRRRRVSEYGTHLREKQKARQIYGVLEAQFSRYVEDAFRTPGVTGVHLLRMLERRLDNVVFLLGFADSRKQARQMVSHGHFLVNGVRTDIPSFLVSPGETLAWKETDKTKDFYKECTDGLPKRPIPPWLSLDTQTMSGKVLSIPNEEDLQQQRIDSRLIVEFYSR